jgi:hypothetical protein
VSLTPGGLVLLDGKGNGNGHPSASLRREQMLQFQLAQGSARENHYLTLIAYLVITGGGKAVVPAQALGLQYDIAFTKDKETNATTYTASLHVEPAVEPPPVLPSEESS